jgi:predicted component of type VI protein secretion system
MLQLTISNGDGAIAAHVLAPGELTIGRGHDNDLVLADETTSPRHARVIARAGSVLLIDLGSEHGTWLNGAQIARPRYLVAGDRVLIGASVLDVAVAAMPEPVPASKPWCARVVACRAIRPRRRCSPRSRAARPAAAASTPTGSTIATIRAKPRSCARKRCSPICTTRAIARAT